MAAKSFVSSVETVEPGRGWPRFGFGFDLVLLIASCCLLIARFQFSKSQFPGFPITGSPDHQITRSLGDFPNYRCWHF
jgi:hypothetical protein